MIYCKITYVHKLLLKFTHYRRISLKCSNILHPFPILMINLLFVEKINKCEKRFQTSHSKKT